MLLQVGDGGDVEGLSVGRCCTTPNVTDYGEASYSDMPGGVKTPWAGITCRRASPYAARLRAHLMALAAALPMPCWMAGAVCSLSSQNVLATAEKSP